MKKLTLICTFAAMLTACNDAGSKFIGKWQNVGEKKLVLDISKNKGGENYIVEEIVTTPAHNEDNFITGAITHHEARVEKFDVTATLDGEILNVSMPLRGIIPMKIEKNILIFNIGATCKDCEKYQKISD